jgi:hypothetical protein
MNSELKTIFKIRTIIKKQINGATRIFVRNAGEQNPKLFGQYKQQGCPRQK